MANNAVFLATHPGYMHTYYFQHDGKNRQRIETMGAGRQSKICKACGIEKSRTEYTIRQSEERNGHFVRYCKECSAAKVKRIYQIKHRDPTFYRRIDWPSKLKRLYGLTVEDYNKLLVKQGGGCVLCGETDPSCGSRHYIKNNRTAFDVDHNHKTGKIRGLLCTRCNRLVGLANDKIQTAKNLVKYLRKEG